MNILLKYSWVMYLKVDTNIKVRVCIYIYIYVYVCIYMYVCVCMGAWKCVSVFLVYTNNSHHISHTTYHIYTYTHIHTHIHTHTHTQPTIEVFESHGFKLTQIRAMVSQVPSILAINHQVCVCECVLVCVSVCVCVCVCVCLCAFLPLHIVYLPMSICMSISLSVCPIYNHHQSLTITIVHCTYTHIHTYIHIHTYTHIYTYYIVDPPREIAVHTSHVQVSMCMYMCVCMHVCVCMYIFWVWLHTEWFVTKP